MKSISKNSIYYIIYNFLNILFPLITGIYVSHVLLASSIGEVEAARNVAQYFVILAYLGIPTYGIREIAKARKNKKELSKVFSELTIINTISTAIFLVIYLILIASIPTYKENFVVYLITGGSIALNFLNISWLYEGLEEFSFICVRNLIFKIICFALLIIFVRSDNDYLLYAAITVIGVAGNYLLNVVRARKYVSFQIRNLDFKKHLKPILFLVVVNLAIEIYTLVDITMIKFIQGNEAVAYYSYGSKIYKIILTLLNSFAVVIVPRLSFFKKENDENKYNELLSKTLNVLLVLSIPIVIGIFFTSDFLVTAIYGNEYIRSSSVLKIISLNLVISPIGYLLGSRVLLVSGQEKKMVIPVAVGAIVNIICNIFLIRAYEETGAAFASVIGELFVAFIYILLSKKYFNLKLSWKNVSYVILGSLLMLLCLFALDKTQPDGLLKVLKEIIVGSAIYFVSLYSFGEMTTRHYLNVMLRKL